MATIQQRGNSYKIIVSLGYSVDGKQVRHTTTYKPDEKMTAAQIKKEVQRQAVLFEENCKQGQTSKAVKFEDYARQWFEEVAQLKLKQRTLANYHSLEKRIYKAIGHLRMDKITPRDIQKFILQLSDGERLDKYKTGKLAPKTIRNYVALISTIYEHAIKMQIVSSNPCRAATLPKKNEKEREVYSLEEAKQILELLYNEDKKHFDYVIYFILAIYTGFRREELLGLEWKDISFDEQTVTVNRTSNYTSKEIFTDTPKTRTSYRTLKLPAEIMDLLKQYRRHQQDYINSIGDKWINTDRLFTAWNGKPMFPTNPSEYFKRLCERNGIRFLPNHSLRHLNASVQIHAGIDVKTMQMNLGHSSATTTLSIYCHAFGAAQAVAMDKIVNVIGVPPVRTPSQNHFRK